MLLVNIGCKISFLPGTKWGQKTGWQAESGRGMFIFCQGGSTFSITIDFVAGTEDGPVPVRAQCRSHASFWSKVKVGQEAARGSDKMMGGFWFCWTFHNYAPCNWSIADSDCIYIPRMVFPIFTVWSFMILDVIPYTMQQCNGPHSWSQVELWRLALSRRWSQSDSCSRNCSQKSTVDLYIFPQSNIAPPTERFASHMCRSVYYWWVVL